MWRRRDWTSLFGQNGAQRIIFRSRNRPVPLVRRLRTAIKVAPASGWVQFVICLSTPQRPQRYREGFFIFLGVSFAVYAALRGDFFSLPLPAHSVLFSANESHGIYWSTIVLSVFRATMDCFSLRHSLSLIYMRWSFSMHYFDMCVNCTNFAKLITNSWIINEEIIFIGLAVSFSSDGRCCPSYA